MIVWNMILYQNKVTMKAMEVWRSATSFIPPNWILVGGPWVEAMAAKNKSRVY